MSTLDTEVTETRSRSKRAYVRITEFFSDYAKRILLYGSMLTVTYLALSPLIFLIWSSFWTGDPGSFQGQITFQSYIDVYTDPLTYELLLNSVLVATGMVVISMTFGVGFAWLFARTNLPTKKYMELVILAPYAVTGFLYALMYAFTYGSDIGLISGIIMDMMGWETFPLQVFSIWGIMAVTGVNAVPSVYLLVVPALRNMDPSFEEVARIHGAGPLTTIWKISLPVIVPALASAALITFVHGLGLFSIVAILGVPDGFHVFATRIWVETSREPTRYAWASALSVTIVFITAVLIYIYRKYTRKKEKYMTVTGSGFSPRQWDLGKYRWPMASTLWVILWIFWILPILVMFIVAVHRGWYGELTGELTLLHFERIINSDLAIRSFINSFIIGLGGALLGTMLISLFAYYTERTDYRFRGFADFISLTPMAIPGIIMGVSVLFTYLWLANFTPINLYGTLWIIMIGTLAIYIPTGTRMAIGSIVQIHTELEEAARISGATWFQQVRAVFVPLFKGTMGVIFFYLFIHLFRHLSIAIMTYVSGTETVAVLIFNFWTINADLEGVAALTSLFLFIMIGILLLVRVLGIKFYEVA